MSLWVCAMKKNEDKTEENQMKKMKRKETDLQMILWGEEHKRSKIGMRGIREFVSLCDEEENEDKVKKIR